MTAAVVESYGDPQEVIKIKRDVEVPDMLSGRDPDEESVLVEVYTASINPVDYKIIRGYAQKVFPQTLPFVPGADVAGVVVKVTPNCKTLKVGDKIWCNAGPYRLGTFAEYVKLPENIVGLMPRGFSFEQAASVPLAGLTAFQALKTHAGLQSGQTVLILGASGGVGSFAVQIAKAFGAKYVATTCGSRHIDFVKSLGSDYPIDYTEEDWSQTLKGKDFDIIFDCIGEKDGWKKAQNVLGSSSTYVTTALEHNQDIGQKKFKNMVTKPDGDDLKVLCKLAEEKKLQTHIEHVYSFEEILDMFKQSEGGHVCGKLVLSIRK